MVKKTAAVSAVAAFSVTAVALAATSFSDVPADHWGANAIMWANDSGIMTGPGEMPGKFDPSGNVNRAQLAVVSERLYKKIMADVKEMDKADGAMMEDGIIEDGIIEDEGALMEVEITWTESEDGMWYDESGAQLRIALGELQRSVDGRSWGAVEDYTWTGIDGYKYKFDKEWKLSMSMDGETWEASDMWAGDYGYWYMRDTDGKIKWYSDWKEDEAGVWNDKNGFIITIKDDKVQWLKEAGSDQGEDIWEELRDWTWTGIDESMYKFDANWNLTMSSDAGKTWAEAGMWMGADGMWYRVDSEKMLWVFAGY